MKIEAWENSAGEIVRYSMAYINHDLFHGDNGRVFGYDNAHNYHHKHYYGEVISVNNFTSYADQVKIFEDELRFILDEYPSSKWQSRSVF